MAALLFQRPEALLALALLPFLWLLWRRARLRVEHTRAVLAGGEGADGLSAAKLRRADLLRGALRVAALAALLVGLSGPSLAQPGALSAASVPVVFVMDVSASMGATDVAPDRLGAARRAAERIALLVPASRTGLVAVAQDAVVLCPLTEDRGAFLDLLGRATTDLMSGGGTRLSVGMEQARTLIERDAGAGVAVLLSDGEDYEEPPVLSADLGRMRRGGILTHTVLVGSPEGAVLAGAVSPEGPDEPVVSKARPEQMSDWAAAGGGRAWAMRPDGLDALPSRPEEVIPRRLVRLAAARDGALTPLAVYCYVAAAVLLATDRLLGA
jgi:Ca-activated chloride channel family protein